MCTTCEENAEPVPYVATPIFWSVVKDMRAAGHDLPWYQIFKPSGTISTLDETSTGMHPIHAYQAYIRAGLSVRNPGDFIRIIDPT